MAKSVKSFLAWSLIVLGVLFLLAALAAPADARVGGLFISGIFIAAGIYFKKKGEPAKSQQSVSQPRQNQAPKADAKASMKESEGKKTIQNESEEQLKNYIDTNVINSSSCTSRKYSNKDVNFEWLLQEL